MKYKDKAAQSKYLESGVGEQAEQRQASVEIIDVAVAQNLTKLQGKRITYSSKYIRRKIPTVRENRVHGMKMHIPFQEELMQANSYNPHLTPYRI